MDLDGVKRFGRRRRNDCPGDRDAAPPDLVGLVRHGQNNGPYYDLLALRRQGWVVGDICTGSRRRRSGPVHCPFRVLNDYAGES